MEAEWVLEGENSGEGAEYSRESWEAGTKRLTGLIREALVHEGEEIEYSKEWFDQRMDEVKAEFERRRSA